jgi:hypothetical protein
MSSRLQQGLVILALGWAGCAAPTAATPAQTPAVAATAPAPLASPVIARVDGQPITAAALATHQAATKLEEGEALEDLVDLTLLRSALRANGLALDTGTPATRAAAEYALAGKLSLPLPPASDTLTVDHAWTKDASASKKRAAQRATMERLRALVAAGATIPGAQKELAAQTADWHIGDHEEYPYSVVPAAAHDLAPGALSPIIPGDGGIHLFTIHGRKQVPPAAEVVHPVVRERLRDGKTIERAGGPGAN